MSYKIAGIDVHKKVLTLSWLPEQGVKEAVMESTARPVLAAGVVGIGAMHALARKTRVVLVVQLRGWVKNLSDCSVAP